MDELDEIARLEIQPGWSVLDADGHAIGQVAEVGTSGFTIEGAVGSLLEVDFRDVESADDGTVALAVSGDELSPGPGS